MFTLAHPPLHRKMCEDTATSGKAGFLTRDGIKVVLEKHVLKVMDSATVGIPKGDPDYYHLDVPYALRVTWSGEFVHAAPWSTANQGLANVSHGCVGMSLSNAIWFFNLATSATSSRWSTRRAPSSPATATPCLVHPAVDLQS